MGMTAVAQETPHARDNDRPAPRRPGEAAVVAPSTGTHLECSENAVVQPQHIQRGHAPTFAHAVEAFLATHHRGGAWSPGTTVKYRQTLAGLTARLDDTPVARDLAALDTPAGTAARETAFTDTYGALTASTRAHHLATLRSALRWWRERGWLAASRPLVAGPRGTIMGGRCTSCGTPH
jgi:hypothetical protein